MSKFFLFALLVYITGNPFLALILLLIIIYAVDRRFVGLMPSIVRPFRLARKLARLRKDIQMSPYDTSAKLELARVYIEKRQYSEAGRLLEAILPIMDQSADVHFELGLCCLKLGRLEEGRRLMARALELNPRVRYGEPYLRLAEALSRSDPEEAIRYIERFRTVQSSSCEAYYRLGRLYETMGRGVEAKAAYREVQDVYRLLPGYSRRQQRRWALLARWKAI